MARCCAETQHRNAPLSIDDPNGQANPSRQQAFKQNLPKRRRPHQDAMRQHPALAGGIIKGKTQIRKVFFKFALCYFKGHHANCISADKRFP